MQEYLNLKNVKDWQYLINKLLLNKEISTENQKDWDTLLKYASELKLYFEVMEYYLKIDDNYWFAYLEEFEDMQIESLSKKQKLSFWVTLFLCILREYVYKKEEEKIYSNAFIITFEEIKNTLGDFLKDKYENDEKKLSYEIKTILSRTIDLWVLSDLWDNRYKIHKILKAKLSVEKMQEILQSLEKRVNESE